MFPWLRWGLLVAVLGAAAPCGAQDASPPRGNWFGEHVRLSGEASASMSTLGAEEEGWFNYSDYENSTVRSVRLSLVGEVTLLPRLAVITEIRTLQFEAPEAYALFVRIGHGRRTPSTCTWDACRRRSGHSRGASTSRTTPSSGCRSPSST